MCFIYGEDGNPYDLETLPKGMKILPDIGEPEEI